MERKERFVIVIILYSAVALTLSTAALAYRYGGSSFVDALLSAQGSKSPEMTVQQTEDLRRHSIALGWGLIRTGAKLALLLSTAATLVLLLARRPTPRAILAATFLMLPAAELAVIGLLIFPAALPAVPEMALRKIRSIYAPFIRRIMHAEDESAEYDRELTYRLKPGVHRHANPEFSNLYNLNRLGLRDDEGSLNSPEVVVLGDSYALGYGVSEEESFAGRLERQLGVRLLNAGVISYGTVRELQLLNRLDLSAVRAIVIQYCSNDVWENRDYQRRGNRFVPSSEARFEEMKRAYREARTYYPGKYLVEMIRSDIRAEARDVARAGRRFSRRSEVEYFLNALTNSPVDISRIPVFVIELSPHPIDRSFLGTLEEEISRRGIGNIRPVQMPLNRNDYFLLDSHLNAGGHMRVSNELAKAMNATFPQDDSTS